MLKTNLMALSMALVSVAASCGGDHKEVLVPASEVAPRMTPAQAVDSIAEQRCNHEASCNAIGPTAKFGSMDHCLQTMRADASQELGGNDCFDGIADRNLDNCLGEIATKACSGISSSIDQLKVHNACRTGNICLN